jgi:7-cyano-7-deazaguanine synthase
MACADFLKKEGLAVRGIFVDYGQAAAGAEGRAVRAVAKRLRIPLQTATLRSNHRFGPGELLGRNLFLVSTALFLADPKPGLLAIGLHAGSPYYDCTPRFCRDLQALVSEQTNGATALVVPFLSWSKAQVFEYAVRANLPVAATYSCEIGTQPECGHCLSCLDMRELLAR